MTLFEAILPVVLMLVLLTTGALFGEIDRELLVLVMLAAAAAATFVALRHGKTWDDVQKAAGKKVADVLPAILILLAIGMLIGCWVLSGTIPTLVAWGLRLVSPQHLVLTAFLSTAAMSLATGTSWGSAGTLGVALMGMAAALDVPLGAAAGAVVSGAYFGDKMSPLSDTTNICAIGAGADLYAHIRHMLYTALPSFGVAVAVYAFIAPGGVGDGLPPQAERLLADVDLIYDVGLWTMLPPLIVIVGIVRRIAPAIAMTLSSLVAIMIGVVVQGFPAGDALRVMVRGFDSSALLPARGIDAASAGEAFHRLANRGGLDSMVPTLLLILAAFLLAGAMEASGALTLMIARLLAKAKSAFGLIAATMTAGGVTVALTSHTGVTALVIGGLFQDAYRERHLTPVYLSRSMEDSVTLTEPLMPWTVSASFMAATLGVATLDYLPWAIFCLGGPIFSLLLAGRLNISRTA